MGQYWLEFEVQGHRQRRDFQQTNVSIGRDPSSDLQIDHPTVSRQHALIVQNYNAHQLVVLSRNGLTAVDGQVVQGTIDLRSGMTLQIGEIQLAFRSAAGSNVGEVPTEAVSLGQFGVGGELPTGMSRPIEESTAPTHDAPSWNNMAPNPNPNPGFGNNLGNNLGNNPQGSGFGNAPQGGFGNNPQGSGFGQMPIQQPQGQNPYSSGFGQMPIGGFGGQQQPQQQQQQHPQQPNLQPSAAPAKATDSGDDFKIKSWEEIAAEAATGAHGAISGATDFERIQKAQAKANKGGLGPLHILALVAAVGFAGFALFYEPEPPPVDNTTAPPERCANTNICYPVDAEPTCRDPADCQKQAEQAYKVAKEFHSRRDAAIINPYEAYKQLDKAMRLISKSGLEEPPDSMRDLDERFDEYEESLNTIAREHRIRQHQLRQRRMNEEMVANVRAWQAYFPDTYNTWFREALEEERKMRDNGSWPNEK